MKIDNMVENKDGSATFSVEMTETEASIFIELGILTAIRAGINSIKDFPPTGDNIDGAK